MAPDREVLWSGEGNGVIGPWFGLNEEAKTRAAIVGSLSNSFLDSGEAGGTKEAFVGNEVVIFGGDAFLYDGIL